MDNRELMILIAKDLEELKKKFEHNSVTANTDYAKRQFDNLACGVGLACNHATDIARKNGIRIYPGDYE